jgi:hypothetical protein
MITRLLLQYLLRENIVSGRAGLDPGFAGRTGRDPHFTG